MSRRVLTADEIWAAGDIHKEWVAIPEWRPQDANGDECGVYVTTLDWREKLQWESECTDDKGKALSNELVIATGLAHSCVDESGNRLFTAENITKLDQKSGAVVVRLWKAFQRLNVFTDADVSELAKN